MTISTGSARPPRGVHAALVPVPADDRADLVPHRAQLLGGEEGQGRDDPAAFSHSGDQRRFTNTSLIRANRRSCQTCSSAPAATFACSVSRSDDRSLCASDSVEALHGRSRPRPRGLLDEAVLRERSQVERAVGGRLAERLAGLGRGQRGMHAEQLDQGHPDGVGKRAHHGRVGDAHALALVRSDGGAGWLVGSELTFRNTTLETVLFTSPSEDFFQEVFRGPGRPSTDSFRADDLADKRAGRGRGTMGRCGSPRSNRLICSPGARPGP